MLTHLSSAIDWSVRGPRLVEPKRLAASRIAEQRLRGMPNNQFDLRGMIATVGVVLWTSKGMIQLYSSFERLPVPTVWSALPHYG